MKLVKKIVGVFTLIALINSTACSKENDSGFMNTPTPPSISANMIMPLGASRVAGDRPTYESYRYELWKLLIDAGYDFDFIGTETDNASYPDYNGMSFDRNHEGRGGISSSGILEELEIWLNDLGAIPDIVLFSSPGGNDGIDQYPQTLININTIIDILQTRNPSIVIYLELPAPALQSEQTPEFLQYYNQALQDLPLVAQQKTTTTSKVLTVDMSTGFIDAYLADDVHYSEAGAVFIANQYYDELVSVLQ